MNVLVTGGSGKLGLAAIDALLEAGHEVVNADRARPTNPRASERAKAVHFIETDLGDVGQVAGALKNRDAVLHLGAIPNPYGHADEVVFRNNVMNTFSVLQACELLGIKKAAIASSLSALGPAWSPKPFAPLYAPVDEEHPLLVQDAYGLSKEVDERTAQMFHRRTGMQVVCLRFHWIAYPDETRARAITATADPRADEWWRHLWAYVDIRDAASLCVAAIEAEGLGWDVVQCTADDTLADHPTEDLIRQHAAQVEIRAPIKGTDSAFTNAKGNRLLGWKPVHSWRDPE
jgi:nucleoside-diphosphate-sugar epimerase